MQETDGIITNRVMPGGGLKPPPKPADCTPAEASLCFTTRKFATTVSEGQTKTTATSTTERCATITGCNFKDAETTKDSDVCTIERRAVEATAAPGTTNVPGAVATINQRSALLRRADEPLWCNERPGNDNILLMKRPKNADHRAYIIEVLERRKEALSARNMVGNYLEIRSATLGFTAFFYVYNLGRLGRDFFKDDLGRVSTCATAPRSAADTKHLRSVLSTLQTRLCPTRAAKET
jgi:chitinase